MGNILINYADGKYYRSQQINSETGLEIGGFDEVLNYDRSSLSESFRSRNQSIFNMISSGYWGNGHRGAGYWLWKPYIIHQTLLQATKDDVIFYSDSGTSFVENMGKYFDYCRQDDKGVILFDSCGHHNSQWTKRDCFFFMGLDEPKYAEGVQITASFHLVRKTQFALEFYQEFLTYAQDPRIITDEPNCCGLDNYPDFEDHRHDQSIASLLAIKYRLRLLIDPSQCGNIIRGPQDLPEVIYHHRNQH